VLSHHKDFVKLKEKIFMAPKAVKRMDVTDKIKVLNTRA
jgi:hypothetical protein